MSAQGPRNRTRVKEDEIRNVIRVLFDVEDKLEVGNPIRRAMYKARCDLEEARFLNRENHDRAQETEVVVYLDLGNHSATPPERAIGLECHNCEVRWTGCMDASACPKCGSTKDYEEKTRRNYDRTVD